VYPKIPAEKDKRRFGPSLIFRTVTGMCGDPDSAQRTRGKKGAGKPAYGKGPLKVDCKQVQTEIVLVSCQLEVVGANHAFRDVLWGPACLLTAVAGAAEDTAG
jgi:hypothetical protein